MSLIQSNKTARLVFFLVSVLAGLALAAPSGAGTF
ncbi:hypothetical protein Mgrana_03181 [Meiothermus granaticius NBRC 107808]|uniref:Uncharacterized protein n=1 Tax=Meiothermus granaticius NBRC 107808 TaxID=1227551 RepID=A0A399F776_9DEIN|nr:hypothetical protein Mgrana_03181 [Meiothermus granaticius NBRC 107808]